MLIRLFIVVSIFSTLSCVSESRTKTVKGLPMNFIRIEPGTFRMGSPADEVDRIDNERPHEVRITRAFSIASTPVTCGQFAQFVQATGHQTAAEREGWAYGAWNTTTNAWDKIDRGSWRNPGFEQTDEHPVVCVDWNDAIAYCKWLSERDGRRYRLPTEAEWEFACRAGSTTAYPWGTNPADGAGFLNGLDLSAKHVFTLFPPFPWSDGFVHTSPVKQNRPNKVGLHDTLGNALEWCSDWFADYPESAVDPTGPETGTQRCLRGGAFVYGPKHCRSAFRGRNSPEFRNFYIGFRVVRDE